jgi:hypothetical protein
MKALSARERILLCMLFMLQYQLGSDPYNNFLLPMRQFLEQTTNTNCGKVRRVFLKSAEQYISEIYK